MSEHPLRHISKLIETNPTTELAAKHWIDDRMQAVKDGGFIAEIVTLTPIIARELLAYNAGNRPLRSTRVRFLVDDILAGAWQLNGEPIIVSRTGELNDGQHRCEAVVQANEPIRTLVVFGFDRDTRQTIDTGATRGSQDHIAALGFANSATLAAIARFAVAFNNTKGKKLGTTAFVTTRQVLELVRADTEDLERAAKFATGHIPALKRVAPGSVIGFAHWALVKRYGDDAERWLLKVLHGYNLSPGEPAYLLRERLMIEQAKIGARSGREARAELVLRYFLAHIKGQTNPHVAVMNTLPTLHGKRVRAPSPDEQYALEA